NLSELLLAGLVDLGPRHGVGVNHGGPAFALADAAAEGQGLPEGHPGRGAEPTARGLGPEQEDVDAAVGFAVVAERTADAGGRGPGLDPGPDAVLQLGDDPVGDPGVEVRASGFVG